MRIAPVTGRPRRLLGVAVASLVLAGLTLGPRSAASKPVEGHAKMKRAVWLAPDATHVIEPHGTITTLEYPTLAVTKLPPDEALSGNLSLTVAITFDTTSGTRAPIKFKDRSGIIRLTFSPDDIKDDVIQPSAIDGTTATVHVKVTAPGPQLAFLKNVYYEAVQFWLPGQKKRAAAMQWTWKPVGQHDK